MAQFEKGNKKGNRFTSVNQPKTKGRGESSALKYIRKVTGKKVNPQSSKDEILKIIQHIFESSVSELDPLIKTSDGKPNKDTPVWVLNIIAAINSDIRYGRTTTIEMLFDRVFGKLQQIDITTNGKDITQEPLQVHVVTNTDEYRKILDEIKQEKERKDEESESEAEDE